MLKRLMLCLTMICMAVTFSSCANKNNKGDDNLLNSETSTPHPSDNYSREENIEYFNDNYDLINDIITEMKKYDFFIAFEIREEFECFTNDESDKALVLENEELISKAKKLLEDNIFNCIEKSEMKDDGFYKYLLYLTVSKKGYSCSIGLYEVITPEVNNKFKIKDNWYYTEGLNV